MQIVARIDPFAEAREVALRLLALMIRLRRTTLLLSATLRWRAVLAPPCMRTAYAPVSAIGVVIGAAGWFRRRTRARTTSAAITVLAVTSFVVNDAGVGMTDTVGARLFAPYFTTTPADAGHHMQPA